MANGQWPMADGSWAISHRSPVINHRSSRPDTISGFVNETVPYETPAGAGPVARVGFGPGISAGGRPSRLVAAAFTRAS